VIRAAGVAIPAHDEESLLPACLAAVQQAARRLTIPVHVVVVADACTDRTAARARQLGAVVVEIGARNVGAARSAGIGQLMSQVADLDPTAVWLATTDADTLVPRCWLARQLAHAAEGWEAVAGTVTVADWAGHPAPVPSLFHQRYRAWQGHHPHVHGANLGFTARAYLAAGGFKPLPTAEDHDLVNSLVAAGIPVLRTARIPVVTSARTHARAPSGFGWLLGTLAALGDDAAPTPQEKSA
jgi:glycosyltransferase involved in cell wall biosynthesis